MTKTAMERAEKLHDDSGCECAYIGRKEHIEWFANQISAIQSESWNAAKAKAAHICKKDEIECAQSDHHNFCPCGLANLIEAMSPDEVEGTR